jgi:hypothetical protein
VPVRFQVILDQYVGNLREYRAIALDVGNQDNLRTDTGKLHDALEKYSIHNSFEVYTGTHTSAVADRFQNHVMPFFSAHLCDSSAQSGPFKTLTRAQAAVRRINASNSVTVQLADGTYRLANPLRFTARDGGHNSYVVTWEAAPDAHPILSGGTAIVEVPGRLEPVRRRAKVTVMSVGSQ